MIKLHDIDTSSVYDEGFIKEVNSASDKFRVNSDYANEVFLYFFVPFLEKVKFISKCGDSQKISVFRFYEKQNLLWGVSSFDRLSLFRFVWLVCSIALFFFGLFFLFLLTFFLAFYLMCVNSFEESFIQNSKYISVARSKGALSKMGFLVEEEVDFYHDRPFSWDCSKNIYSAPLLDRLLGCFIVPYYFLRDYWGLFFDTKEMLGLEAFCGVFVFYFKRVPHKVCFEYYFKVLLSYKNPEKYYTGNKEDRFAAIESRVCGDFEIKIVCIPHGLEYSFKMPLGLVGDEFYCNSDVARVYLSTLYCNGGQNFLFDESIVKKMLDKELPFSNKGRVVFFTESREIEKNVVIVRKLKEMNIDFFLKLHPKDSFQNYSGLVDKKYVILDLAQAISGSICLARKSTILLEAIYNNSISIAVLNDLKDRAYFELVFPSLNDPKIVKVYSLSELINLLSGMKNSHV